MTNCGTLLRAWALCLLPMVAMSMLPSGKLQAEAALAKKKEVEAKRAEVLDKIAELRAARPVSWYDVISVGDGLDDEVDLDELQNASNDILEQVRDILARELEEKKELEAKRVEVLHKIAELRAAIENLGFDISWLKFTNLDGDVDLDNLQSQPNDILEQVCDILARDLEEKNTKVAEAKEKEEFEAKRVEVLHKITELRAALPGHKFPMGMLFMENSIEVVDMDELENKSIVILEQVYRELAQEKEKLDWLVNNISNLIKGNQFAEAKKNIDDNEETLGKQIADELRENLMKATKGLGENVSNTTKKEAKDTVWGIMLQKKM